MSNGKVSLKMIEKRLSHLRQQLRNLTKRQIPHTTSNLLAEQDNDDHDEHQRQYKQRLHHLLRLYDKQVKNLNHWHNYRSDVINYMYRYETQLSEETFQTQKLDCKLKLLATLHDQRRFLDFKHQNISIHSYNFPDDDRRLRKQSTDGNDGLPLDGHISNESTQRSTYNLRRAIGNDCSSETSSLTSISLKDLSIFSRSNSLLPPFGGIELQRCLSTTVIEQDVQDIQRNLFHTERHLFTHQVDEPIRRSSSIDVRIEDGRLWYQNAWFARNAHIFLIFDGLEIVPALVLSIGRNDLLVRRLGANIKHRISLSLLHDGHVTIRKRNCNT
ncbi:unnamed protein product [Adineta ricciae]|uniref:Uncharacterized protein n=1 Tax=Adineta ricciae TaxID=249248 RepID=A0A814QDU1_ADIRI|nr:unnamed protein product [Adineta ricciae]